MKQLRGEGKADYIAAIGSMIDSGLEMSIALEAAAERYPELVPEIIAALKQEKKLLSNYRGDLINAYGLSETTS